MIILGSTLVGSDEVITVETVLLACGIPDTEYCICWWLYSFAVSLNSVEICQTASDPSSQSLTAENGQTMQLLAEPANATVAQSLEAAAFDCGPIEVVKFETACN